MRPRPLSYALVSVLAIAASACGGSGGGHAATSQCAAQAGLKGSVNDTGTKAAAGDSVSIEAQDSQFSPTCTTGVPGGSITVTVHNAGTLLHNFSVPGQGVDRDVQPGQTITVKIKAGTAPLPYFCKYHRYAGMVGALLPSG